MEKETETQAAGKESSEGEQGEKWEDNFIVVLGGCFVLWCGVGRECLCWKVQ